jgi:hypothetical protein
MRHAHWALAAAVTTAAACGGNGGDDAACDGLESMRQQLGEFTITASGDELDALVDDLAAVDAPREIDDAVDQLIAAYTQVADVGSITDPDVAGQLADAQAAATEIDAFVQEECGDPG